MTKRDEIASKFSIVDAVKWLMLGKYDNWREEQAQEANKSNG